MLAGTYGVTRGMFGVGVLIVFGIIGFLMKQFGFSIPAFIIGFVLGGQLESWLQRSYILVSNDSGVLTRPSFIITALILVFVIFVMNKAKSTAGNRVG